MSSKSTQQFSKIDQLNTIRRIRRRILAASALALGGLLASNPAHAATYTWTGGGGGLWDTTDNNWNGGTGTNPNIWTSYTNDAVFATSGDNAVNNTANLVFKTLTFNANATVTGTGSFFNGGTNGGSGQTPIITTAAGVTASITPQINWTDNHDGSVGMTFNTLATGELSIGNWTTTDGNQKLTIKIDGGGKLDVTGTMNNQYTGGNAQTNRTTVGAASAGNIVHITGRLLTNSITVGESTFGGNHITFDPTVAGSTGSPTLAASGSNVNDLVGGTSSNNSITLNAGAVMTSNRGNGGNTVVIGRDSGANTNGITVNGAGAIWQSTNTNKFGLNGSFNSLTISNGGVVTGEKFYFGGGQYEAAGANVGDCSNNTGDITGVGSTLTTSNGNNGGFSIGTAPNASSNGLTVEAGGTANLKWTRAGFDNAIGGGGTAGKPSNSNFLTAKGVGTILNESTNSPLVIGGRNTSGNSSGGSDAVGTGNHLDIYDGAVANFTMPIEVRGTNSAVNLGNGTANISNTNIQNTQSGTTGYTPGILMRNNTASVNFNNGRLTAGSAGLLISGAGPVTLTNTGYVSTTQANSEISSQIINGTGNGNLTKENTGTLILSNANNTYSGTTTVSAGTLRLSAANNNNIANSATINVAGGATLDLSTLSGSTLSLASAQTLMGTGTVSGNVTAPNNSTLAPGGASIGALTLTGTVNLAGSGIASFRLGATGINDQAIVNGALTYGGYLKISSAPDTTVGNTWQIFKPLGGSSGIFTNDFVFGTDGSGSGGLLPTISGKLWEFNYGTGTLSIAAGGPTSGNYFAPGVAGGGSGNWDSLTNVWATTPGVQGAGGQATTGALNFADAPGTATINGTATAVAGINFLSDGHIIAPGTSSPNLNLAAATPATNLLMVAAASTATISAQLTGSNGMTKDGPGTLLLSADNSGLTGGIFVNNGILQTQHLNALGASATGSATVQPGGTLLVDVPGVHLQSLTINGTVKTTSLLDQPATHGNIELGTVDGSGNTVVAGSLTFGPSGLLDLQDRTLLVHYTQSPTTPSILDGPVNAIKAALVQGRNVAPGGVFDGPWTGTVGITSTRAMNDFSTAHIATGSPNTEFYALGYGDTGKQTLGDGTITNKMLINDAGPSFFDPTANGGRGAGIGSTVFVRYTRVGDATMDGIVGNNDVTVLGLNFDPNYNPLTDPNGPKQWYDGDFNYNGIVDNNDVTILGLQFDPSNTSAVLFSSLVSQYGASFAASFAQGFASSHPTASVVPEPGVLTLLGVGALALIRRRRRA